MENATPTVAIDIKNRTNKEGAVGLFGNCYLIKKLLCLGRTLYRKVRIVLWSAQISAGYCHQFLERGLKHLIITAYCDGWLSKRFVSYLFKKLPWLRDA
jgi:hypothetical protein